VLATLVTAVDLPIADVDQRHGQKPSGDRKASLNPELPERSLVGDSRRPIRDLTKDATPGAIRKQSASAESETDRQPHGGGSKTRSSGPCPGYDDERSTDRHCSTH
jgi:hypothetical protein